MYIYIVELISVWLFGFFSFKTTIGKYYNKRKVFLWLSFGMMTVILGCRGATVGEDTLHYVELFRKTDSFSWIDIFTGFRVNWINEVPWPDTMEVGFAFVAKFAHSFTDNPQWFLVIVATITSVGFAKLIYDNCENEEGIFIATYVYMCECMYMMAFNGARQMMAVSIGINAYTLIYNRKYLKGILLVLFATLFHNTAIILLVMIPFMILRRKNEERNCRMFKYMVGGCLIVPLICPVANYIFSYVLPRYTLYFSNNYWEIHIGGSALLWGVELCLVILMYKRHFKEQQSFELSILIMIYLTFEFISFTYSAFNRVAWYYRAYLVLFFPVAMAGIRNGCIKKLVKVCIYLLITALFMKYASTDSRNYVFLLEGV